MCSPDGFQVRSEVEVGQNLLSCFWRLNNTTSILTSLIILKSRDITLPRMAHLVKAMVFPVVMYGCESWTIRKAERWKIDAFELWCWRRLLGVLWTARRSEQAILKESVLGVHWKDWCWSWNSNTSAIWCEELTYRKDPDAGKDWR